MESFNEKRLRHFLIFLIFAIVIGTTTYILYEKFRTYRAEDFDIQIITSNTDFDEDGIDDYTDILEGAKIEAEKKVTYKSAYYICGYPPEDEGVCTDLIWRAFKNAGYCLKDMVDEDIAENTDEYYRVEGKPNKNIDFRRVPNLDVYFKRNHISLTLDLTKIEEWQPGDIVVFGKEHIGIISDKRNKKGIPYLLHNTVRNKREEDILEKYDSTISITGHYRLKDINTES